MISFVTLLIFINRTIYFSVQNVLEYYFQCIGAKAIKNQRFFYSIRYILVTLLSEFSNYRRKTNLRFPKPSIFIFLHYLVYVAVPDWSFALTSKLIYFQNGSADTPTKHKHEKKGFDTGGAFILSVISLLANAD